MSLPLPNILRATYAELIVTDLAAARGFWVDILGLIVTAETDDALYLRCFEDYLHHSLVLRVGPTAACSKLAYRVGAAEDVDLAEAWFAARGCRTERVEAGATLGIGEAVRVADPLGFTLEFFRDATHVPRFTQRYDLMTGLAINRLDHFNIVVPDVPAGTRFYEELGFALTEDISDDDGVQYASWLHRKPTVHDIALTGGEGPRLHHLAFALQERSQILDLCDRLGALHRHEHIERGPGRHGVSNAFYLYLRDPDGHRLEVYTSDYWTGDGDNPVLKWDVNDAQRRDFWANPVVPSWYAEASPVLDLDGHVVTTVARAEPAEVTVGADGFSFSTTQGGEQVGFHVGRL